MSESPAKFLSVADVGLIHDQLIDRYGGSKGALDQGRLESALAMS